MLDSDVTAGLFPRQLVQVVDIMTMLESWSQPEV